MNSVLLSVPVSSKRKQLKPIYNKVNEVASPGDVVFFVSDRTKNTSFSILRRIYRRWQGFADEDNTVWHTSIYTGSKKDSRGSQIRPYIIHAIRGGVEEIHLPPSYFHSTRMDTGEIVRNGHIEVVQNPDLTPAQRSEIVEFVRNHLGKPFNDLDWRHDILTYALGLPAVQLDPGKVSCHGLAFDAYEKIGFSFSHQLRYAPVFNIGKYLGHPLGDPPRRANLRRLYLHDHHLYRDPRFMCILSIFEDNQDREIRTVENPGKYSWNPILQKKYTL